MHQYLTYTCSSFYLFIIYFLKAKAVFLTILYLIEFQIKNNMKFLSVVYKNVKPRISYMNKAVFLLRTMYLFSHS